MAQPGGPVSYQQKFVRCGKSGCRRCAEGPGHGPYWYAAWREGARTRTRYIGKTLPPELEGNAGDTLDDGPSTQGRKSADALARAPAKVERVESALPMAGGAGDSGSAVAPAQLRIWTLGQFRVVSADVTVPDRAWRRQSATVLKLLLLADNRRLPREHIAAYLWPDADEDTARGQLAAAVHALRRALEPDLAAGKQSNYVRQQGANLVLTLGTNDTVDYLDFETMLANASAASDPLAYLEQAAAIYGGSLMPEEESAWCVAARQALGLRWHGVLLSLAEAQAGHRRFDAAAATLNRLLTDDPTNEEAARRLMGLLGRQGRRAEAIKLFERLRQALLVELDAEPAPETLAMAEAMRAGTPPPRGRQREAVAHADQPAAETAAQPAMIGRAGELSSIREAMLAAREGHGSAVVLCGTAGIGKTRLAEEAATTATVLGYTVLWGRAADSEQDLPYAPFAELLHAYVRMRPPGTLRRELAGAEAVRGIVPEVGAMLPNLAQPPPLESNGAERLRLWTAVRSLLAAATASRPMLVIMEDLHWADDATLGLLTFLVRRCRELRIILLGTMRDDNTPEGTTLGALRRGGRREGTLAEIQLSGLSRDELADLAFQQLGAPVTAVQAAALHDQCAGNPLFIMELLALLREPGNKTIAGTMAAVEAGTAALPSSIILTLRQRLKLHGSACLSLLQTGAIIGERFPVDVLSAASAMDPDAFRLALDEGVAAGLLRHEGVGEQGEYALVHGLLRRVLYDDLAPMQRRRLHARVARTLSDPALARATANAAAIAHHYVESDETLLAAIWLERAGDHAARLYAGASAQVHYRKARDLLGQVIAHQTYEATDQSLLAGLTEKLGDLWLMDGEYAAAQAHFAEARGMDGDAVRQAELWRKEGVTWEKRGDYKQALASLGAAELGADGAGDDATAVLPAAVRANLELSRGDVQYSQGAFEAAASAAARALTLLHDQPDSLALAHAAYLQGRVSAIQGDFAGAEAGYQHSLAVREGLGDQQGIASCWYSMGLVAYDRGDPARSRECHHRALAIRERIGDQWGIAFSWGKLAQVARYQGQYAEAEACNRKSLTLRERIGSQTGIARSVYLSGQIARDHGNYAEATALIERGLHIQERIGDQRGCSNSLNDLGDVARDRGELTQADHYARQSLAIRERIGDLLGIAECLHSLGLLAGERGDVHQAMARARNARHLARRIEARGMEATAALGQASTALRAGKLRLAAPLIAYSAALAGRYGSALTALQVALVTANLLHAQQRLPEAVISGRAALELAVLGGFRPHEALAQRALGQCLHASAGGEAVQLFRGACSLLAELGCAVELARAQLDLAAALLGGNSIADRQARENEAADLKAAAGATLRERGASAWYS